jgi:CheY-like chemotaxis protein
MYFRSRGFVVVTAGDGEAVIQTAHDHVSDVIVMDLAMPQFGGITAIERLRLDSVCGGRT